MKAITARALDASAIGLSGLCMLHCLALPFAAVALPMLGGLAEAEWLHLAFVMAAAPLAVLSLTRGRPLSWPLIGLAFGGLALMTAGALGLPSHDWETGLTLAGGLMLAGAHGLNWGRRH